MNDIFIDFDKKNGFTKVSIDRMKGYGKEAADMIARSIINGKMDLGIEKIANDIIEKHNTAMAMEFTKVIGELLKKNGVSVKITEYETENHATNKFEMLYGCSIDGLDFSEHDKAFEDKIDLLKRNLDLQKDKRCEVETARNYLAERIGQLIDESQELKQRIAELENENKNLNIRIFQNEAYGDKKPTKINLNDKIKVKLTPLGAEIYYHRYDELNKQIKENGGTGLEPIMPQIDKDGFTEFQLHHFISLYGEHIGMCKPNVIKPLDIIIVE